MSIVLLKNTEFETVEKKSVFLTYGRIARMEEEAKRQIEEIRSLHPKASHVLYVYSAGGNKGAADEDKEPVSSMHNALKLMQKKGITDSLVVIVRYFGGTLLGASNLDRVYFRLVFEALIEENLGPKILFYPFEGKIRSIYLKPFEKEVEKENARILKKDFEGAFVSLQGETPIKDSPLLDFFR